MIFEPILNFFRGKAVTIPPLDGAFRPNTRLDEAEVFATLADADNLATLGKALFASSGNAVYEIAAGAAPRVVETFAAPVTALAVSPSGELAIGLETGKLVIAGKETELPSTDRCITALAFGGDGALWLANGSASRTPSMWSADLMAHGQTGSVWKRDPGSTAFRELASGLAFPYGLHPTGDGVVVSEAWRHRLLRIDANGKAETVVDHLPGYPSRLSPAGDGGVWLSIFAPRNRLIEFILQEEDYRQDMMAEVEPRYWIAPSLSSSRSFLEPLQCGGIKTMGVHKPWSPTRSYGLVVKLDASLRPVSSLHSRANGVRHGTCSAVELGGRVYVASRGGDAVLAIDPAEAA
ncbi:hypothetical protein ACSBOB_08650 [Mesorhizobium sp. ASY16-5R]|uniref:hypothetical protein n=1 Tax=Mesorhizobium sp. ASY16-5R TaxID=3445772 RepID=UPI003FA04D0A